MSDETLGIVSRIKIFFATMGSIAAGAFMIWGPAEVIDEMREEFSDQWRIGAGIGFMAFGALLGITGLFASGSSGSSRSLAARFKGLLSMAIGIVVLGAILLTFGRDVQLAWQLADNGKPTTAQVTREYVHRGKESTTYSYFIRYDGHHATIKLINKPGKTVPVLYLPHAPKSVMVGRPGDTLIQLLERQQERWPAILMVVIALACVFLIPWGLLRFLLGKKPAATNDA